MYQDLSLFINGDWRAASDGATKAVHDPATEEELGTIAMATEADVDAALAGRAGGIRRLAPARHLGARGDPAQGRRSDPRTADRDRHLDVA